MKQNRLPIQCESIGIKYKIYMSKIFTTVFYAFILSCAGICSAQTQQALKLPDVIVKMLRDAHIPEDAVATKVVRISDGALVAAHNTAASMQPASTMKLVSTLIGLERLGPTYRGRTEFSTAAPLSGNTLQGNLLLQGLADSDLDWRSFQIMLQALRDQGVQDIRGNLVIDRTMFQPPRTDLGAPPFDDGPEFRYNVIPDSLLLNMNLGQFDIASDDKSTSVRMTPMLDGVTVVADMALIETGCANWDDGWKPPTLTRHNDGGVQIHLNGTFPKNCTASTELNMLDKNEFVERLFRSLWRTLGGSFSGHVIESSDIQTATRVLATHRSHPLAEVIRDINKPSDNALARLLYLTLGARLGRMPTLDANTLNRVGTLANAEQEIRAWFAEHKIDDIGLVLDNGSGLSRSERITPSQMTALLMAGVRSNWAPEFLASLPIAGLDGTMRRRLRDSAVAQRARLKTGTLKNVVALAGYVPDGNNELCVVAAFINHPLAGSSVAEPILDALIDWVSKSKTESTWALPLSAYAGG